MARFGRPKRGLPCRWHYYLGRPLSGRCKNPLCSTLICRASLDPEFCKRQSSSTSPLASGLAAFLVQSAFPPTASCACAEAWARPRPQAHFDVAVCWPCLVRFSKHHCDPSCGPNEMLCNSIDRYDSALSFRASLFLDFGSALDGLPFPVWPPNHQHQGLNRPCRCGSLCRASPCPHRHRGPGPGQAQRRLHAAPRRFPILVCSILSLAEPQKEA
jgi:hypothetical protein